MSRFSSTAISERLTRIECPGRVFAYLAQGREKALLVDTGFGYGDLKGYVDSLTSLPYDVVLTHGHYDHAGGAAQFGSVYLNSRDALSVRDGCDPEMRYGLIRTEIPDAKREEIAGTVDICELHELADGRVFDLGGFTVKAVAMPGHTGGYMGLLFPEERTFLAGDGLCSVTLLTFDGSSCIGAYKASLERVKAACWDAVDTVLYSHPHNHGGPQIMDEMIELCGDLLSGKCAGTERRDRDGITLVAKPMGPCGREDGKIANLIFRPDKLQ